MWIFHVMAASELSQQLSCLLVKSGSDFPVPLLSSCRSCLLTEIVSIWLQCRALITLNVVLSCGIAVLWKDHPSLSPLPP